MAFDLGTVLSGASGGMLGYAGGLLQLRYSAENRYARRVDERLQVLEHQVEECRLRDVEYAKRAAAQAQRDAEHTNQISALTLGLRMLVPEMLRKDEANPVLRHLLSVMSALPADDCTFTDLITKLNQIP